jgi:hypothetical protein
MRDRSARPFVLGALIAGFFRQSLVEDAMRRRFLVVSLVFGRTL